MSATARLTIGILFILSWLGPVVPSAMAQTSAGPPAGWLVLSGAGEPIANGDLRRRFADLAGGPEAEIIYIPSAASSIRTPAGAVYDLPDSGRILPASDLLEKELALVFGVGRVRILHTRSRAVADSEEFAAPLLSARAVWIGYGNAGRLMDLIGGTRLAREVEGVLARGGVVGGNSAGAIVQGAFIVRGRPEKPVLVAAGHTSGLGFLKSVSINPHLTSAKRELELVNVVDANPFLLGLGIEDAAGLIVHGDVAEVVGEGRVAVYDDKLHGATWYYYIQPGDRFDLRNWRLLSANSAAP